MTVAYTFQKELVLGNGGNPGLGGPAVNNPFNRQAQKSLASSSQPHIFVTGVSYDTPRIGPNRFVKQLLGNWTIGGLVRIASGGLIQTSTSNNNLAALLGRRHCFVRRTRN